MPKQVVTSRSAQIRLSPRERRAIAGYRTMRDNSDRTLVNQLIASLQPERYAARWRAQQARKAVQ